MALKSSVCGHLLSGRFSALTGIANPTGTAIFCRVDRTLTNWETVHTVHEFDDRPVSGFADLNGRPHAYSRIFDPDLDEWSDLYWLSPITDEQLRLVQADWERWLRWQAAFVEKRLGPADAHPVLAADKAEHQRARQAVEEARCVDASRAVRMVGQFEGPNVLWVSTDATTTNHPSSSP